MTGVQTCALPIFYPRDLRHASQLEYYAGHLDSVEINSTFYRLPERKILEAWHDTVAADFVFTVKASRFITHMKKLKVPARTVKGFFNRIEGLGDKLGAVLFQLPPRWHCNLERLKSFLPLLSRDFRYAFEFRDRSWLVPEVYDLLAAHGSAFCIYDLGGFCSPDIVTTRLVYIRLHGPGAPYQGCYKTRALAAWARKIKAWSAERRSVYCFFDNDQLGYAAINALELAQLVIRDS